jgi:hypothetical protein
VSPRRDGGSQVGSAAAAAVGPLPGNSGRRRPGRRLRRCGTGGCSSGCETCSNRPAPTWPGLALMVEWGRQFEHHVPRPARDDHFRRLAEVRYEAQFVRYRSADRYWAERPSEGACPAPPRRLRSPETNAVKEADLMPWRPPRERGNMTADEVLTVLNGLEPGE